MTNEEKAQEICKKNKQFHVECSSLEYYMSALDMARWKDEQFKQIVKDYIDLAYDSGQEANLLEDILKKL